MELPSTNLAQAAPTAAAEADARKLVTRARAAFEAAKYDEAASLLEEAYALTPTAALLYNLGRAYQQAGQKEKAISAYERYLASGGVIEDEKIVRQTLQTLRDDVKREEELRAQAEAEKARADKERKDKEQAERDKRGVEEQAKRKPSPFPWIVAGAGAGGLIAGAVVGALAKGAHDDAVNAVAIEDAVASQDRAESLALGANVSFIAGGVVGITGLVWGIFDVRAALATKPESSVSVRVSPAGLLLTGTF